MDKMNKEEAIRKLVRDLRTFYTNLVIYGLVSILCILIWLSAGGGQFWPMWVMIGCAVSAILQGISLGKIPKIQEILPFLTTEWEEKQVSTFMQNLPSSSDIGVEISIDHTDNNSSKEIVPPPSDKNNLLS